MRVQDYVLVSIRIGLNPNDCDILYRYNPNEVNQLQERGLLDKIMTDEQEMGIEENEFLEEVQNDNTESILDNIDDDIFDDI